MLFIEKLTGVATFLSLVPQIYKIIKTETVGSFSIFFITGMILANIIFFIIGFIYEAEGLMLGSLTFVVYNFIVVFYYYKNKYLNTK
jgi:uncharacterized protein with PQ loop repeat|tara:strand:- start:3147 stop:3407 length:261 start_codon:yes stop_codon:yes gene_type:complete